MNNVEAPRLWDSLLSSAKLASVMVVETKYMRDRSEDLLSSFTHGLGAILSFIGVPILIILGTARGDVWHVISFTIYGVSLVLLYCASTLYHLVPASRLKEVLRLIDHMCIYLLIAGTYTPFTLVNLRDGVGWTLLCLVWGMALVGLVLKVLFRNRYPILSLVVYLGMGWLAAFTLTPIVEVMPRGAVILLVAGGLSYTGGVLFFLWEKLPHNHTIWHVFVLAGSVLHYFAVLLYVLPGA